MIDPTYLIYLFGCFHLSFIGFCVFLFTFPILLPCYNEPLARILLWGYPNNSKIFFVKHVHATVLHELWYVKSISEYAGARGTTAGKVLQSATSVLGMS